MSKRRLIFLDVDGVLNSMTWKIVRPYHSVPHFNINAPKNSLSYLIGELDITPIALIDELIRDTNAQVVLSSSWRELHCGLDWFKKLLALRGAKLIHKNLIDATPHIASIEIKQQRGKEVEAYLQQQKEHESKDIKYLCIDDCSFHYLEHQPVVETNPGIGFSILDFHDALDLLR